MADLRSDEMADRRGRGRREEARAVYQVARQLPSQDPDDPAYRRLHYVRYADDWLLGFAGPKAEAETIKDRLRVLQPNDPDSYYASRELVPADMLDDD